MSAVPNYCYETQVYYDMTDAAGVVYHSQYLILMARARTQALKACGFSVADLAKGGLLFVVREATLSFIQPARLGEMIEVITHVAYRSKTRLHCQQIVRKTIGESLCCRGKVELVSVNRQLKPIACPQSIIDAFVSIEPSAQ